jgi:glucose/arabinose dehydrogenase
VGGLTNRTLIRVSFGQPSQAERREALLVPLNIRPRDIQIGPDGNLYIATEGASGGNASDGLVLKIEPVQ